LAGSENFVGIVREYVFYVFQNPNYDFLRFWKCHVTKKRKKM